MMTKLIGRPSPDQIYFGLGESLDGNDFWLFEKTNVSYLCHMN